MYLDVFKRLMYLYVRYACAMRGKRVILLRIFNQTMSRDRFQLLTTFLHFNDNEKMSSHCEDKIYKIRPILDYLVNKWRELCALGKHIAIDEGMLKWRGRLSFRVYN